MTNNEPRSGRKAPESATRALDRLGSELRETLQADRTDRPQSDEAHLDADAIAAYVDGAELVASERQRVEEHLATCAECRTVARMAALEAADAGVSVVMQEGKVGWAGARWALAAAALLFVAASWFWFGRAAAPSLGLDVASYQALISGTGTEAVDLLRTGTWPERQVLGALLTDLPKPSTNSIVRSNAADAPEPVAPRWSSVVSTQPIFAFAEAQLGLDQHSESAVEYEVHVLDASETPVARWDVDFARVAGTVMVETVYPADARPLKPGRSYYWKVNAMPGNEVVASRYVPFRVLSAPEERALARELRSLSGQPASRAVELVKMGQLERAVAELVQGAANAEQRTRALELSSGLYQQSGLDDGLATVWLDRVLEPTPGER